MHVDPKWSSAGEMRARSLLVRWGAAIALAALVAAGALQAKGLPPVMPVTEVKAGMTGYGLTTLEPGKVQRFPVEVLGVMRGWYPKGHLVLVRLSGPVIDEAGTVAGMSGSPIYVEDKLVGALAYSWSFSKTPIAGVTPAEEMLHQRELTDATEEDAGAAACSAAAMRDRAARFAAHLTSGDTWLDREHLERAIARVIRPFLPGGPGAGVAEVRGTGPADLPTPAEMRPLPLPLAVTGGGGTGHLLSALEEAWLAPVQASAVAREDLAEAELQPGAPVGVQMVSGDMDVTATGTLTWVDGDRIAAFGHPMLSAGRVNLPLVLGRVKAVVPSLYRSFRLTGAGPVIGRVTEDRDSAVLGRLGEEAPTFPCSVEVSGAVEDRYEYRIAGYWRTAPFFTLLAAAYSSARWQGQGGRYTAEAKVEIELKGRDEPLVLDNVFATSSPSLPAFQLVGMPLASLLTNPFEEVQVAGVKYSIDLRRGFEAALIKSVRTERFRVEPGEEIDLLVTVQKWRGGEEVKRVPLRVPPTAQPGSRVRVLVCDALTSMMLDASLDPGFYAPRSLDALLATLREMEPNRNLLVRAAFVERGVRYRGEALPELPASVLNVMQFGGAGRAVVLATEEVESVPTPWVLEGSESLNLRIAEPESHRP